MTDPAAPYVMRCADCGEPFAVSENGFEWRMVETATKHQHTVGRVTMPAAARRIAADFLRR